jgi:hypothetical protein
VPALELILLLLAVSAGLRLVAAEPNDVDEAIDVP